MGRWDGYSCKEMSQVLEKSNDFSWDKIMEKLQGMKVKFYKNQLFFHKFSFKIQFSLDNKDVQKMCHAEFVSPSILSL